MTITAKQVLTEFMNEGEYTPKDNRITVRLSTEDRQAVFKLAESLGISGTDLLRYLLKQAVIAVAKGIDPLPHYPLYGQGNDSKESEVI